MSNVPAVALVNRITGVLELTASPFVGEALPTAEKRWLVVAEVAAQYPWSPRAIHDGLADGSFPVPAKRCGRKWIFDRRVLETYWESLPNKHVPVKGDGFPDPEN